MWSDRQWMRSGRLWIRSGQQWMISGWLWIRSGQQWIIHVQYLADSGWDLNDCGWDPTDGVWDQADCGWDLGDCGWDPTDCEWDLADCGRDLADWLESLTANAKVATVLDSTPASSGTVKSEGRQVKQGCLQYSNSEKYTFKTRYFIKELKTVIPHPHPSSLHNSKSLPLHKQTMSG